MNGDIHTHVHTYVCSYIRMFIHTYVLTYMHTCTCVYAFLLESRYTCVCAYVRIPLSSRHQGGRCERGKEVFVSEHAYMHLNMYTYRFQAGTRRGRWEEGGRTRHAAGGAGRTGKIACAEGLV